MLRMPTRREQRLVSIATEMVMVAASDEFTVTDPEKIGQWIRDQLDGCGFPCKGPVGMTWAVLVPAEEE